MQSGLFYLIYRQRYLRRWSPEMFAGRVVTLAALPAGNGDETESEGQQNSSHEISVLNASSRRFELTKLGIFYFSWMHLSQLIMIESKVKW